MATIKVRVRKEGMGGLMRHVVIPIELAKKLEPIKKEGRKNG